MGHWNIAERGRVVCSMKGLATISSCCITVHCIVLYQVWCETGLTAVINVTMIRTIDIWTMVWGQQLNTSSVHLYHMANALCYVVTSTIYKYELIFECIKPTVLTIPTVQVWRKLLLFDKQIIEGHTDYLIIKL